MKYVIGGLTLEVTEGMLSTSVCDDSEAYTATTILSKKDVNELVALLPELWEELK